MSDMQVSLPRGLADAVTARLAAWRAADSTRRLWAKDATLWTGTDEARWLGWLDVAGRQRAALPALAELAAAVRSEGASHVAVLGMGGSSLCPYVFQSTFAAPAGAPRLVVLDSTDPSQVRSFEAGLDLARTRFVVSSKSGSTLEPNILRDYFLSRVRQSVGAADAGQRFVAVTDPGSQLDRQARADGFRAVIAGEPAIGGRFSALSAFGLVPAALAGFDVRGMLERADAMAAACREAAPADNPGVHLGLVLGEAARAGRDKLTFIASPGIAALGAWLEQLVAESTGKRGVGIIPVDGERVAAPEAYGTDRLFAYLRHAEAPDAAQDAAVAALERAGHAVVRLGIPDRLALAAEFFRWEIATAAAGAVLGINPFDQPDVEASKIETRRLTDEYERTGALPPETPIAEEGGIRLYADEGNAAALATAPRTLAGLLRGHLARAGAGDYLGLLAYLEMSEAHGAVLQGIRHRMRDARGTATTLGFGPRFLHSTGQAYKGGPNTGVFVQVTCEDARDVPVPGRRFTFGVVKAAQARGDLAVLAARGRRALRVHLGADVAQGLRTLDAAVRQALD